MSEVIYSLKNITKRYEGTVALDNVSVDVCAGQIHSLVGKNGAGKSTLTGIMHGSITPTSGEIKIFGEVVEKMTPAKAKSLGIFLVPQHPHFSLDLTVADNMFLGNFPKSKSGLIDRKTMKEACINVINKFGIDVEPDQYMHRVSLEYRQLLLAGKAFWVENAKIIMLDEITATLALKSKTKLFEIIREEVKNEQKTILLITHRMQEVMELSDCVTVLRDGKKVGTEHCGDLTSTDITRMITGSTESEESIGYMPSDTDNLKRENDFFVIENLCKKDRFENISISLKKGEVIGLAGLEGAGESDVMQCVSGVGLPDYGSVRMQNKELRMKTPKDAIDKKIVYLTRNRETEGILQGRSIAHNLIASQYKKYRKKNGFINEKKVLKTMQEMKELLNIKMVSPDFAIDTLSGGNKQKVLIGRLIETHPQVYLLDHVTQGIDIEAKKEVLKTVRYSLSEYAGVIMSSESIEEMMEICDRICVFFRGKIVADFNRKDFAEDKIFYCMQGFGKKND